MVLTPQVLELFWGALTREIEKRGQSERFERARRIARRLPYALRRLLFRRIHAQLGGELRLLVSAGAYLPPDLQTRVGGPRHRRHAGIRLDRMRDRHRQRRAPSPDGRGRAGASAGRGPARPRVVGDPGPQPIGLDGVLAQRGGDPRVADAGRLVPHRRRRAVHPRRRPRARGPAARHHRAAERAERLSGGRRGGAPRPGARAVGRARDGAGPHRGGRPATGQPTGPSAPSRRRRRGRPSRRRPSGPRSTGSSPRRTATCRCTSGSPPGDSGRSPTSRARTR